MRLQFFVDQSTGYNKIKITHDQTWFRKFTFRKPLITVLVKTESGEWMREKLGTFVRLSEKQMYAIGALLLEASKIYDIPKEGKTNA